MSDRLYGGIRGGGASVRVPVLLRLTSSGLGATGKVAADLTAAYWREGGTSTAITLSDLAAPDSGWSSGGIKEVHASQQPGLYRLDLPDLAVVTGADFVVVTVKGAGLFEWQERFNLETRRSLRRKQAFAGYSFQLRQSGSPQTPAIGLTVTGQRTLNGGAFAGLANSISEISNGWYKVDLAATDLDGEIVGFRFTAPGAIEVDFTHVLEPSGF